MSPAGYRRYPRSFTSEAHLRRRTAKPKHTKAMSKRLVPHSLTLTVDIVRHQSVRRFNGGDLDSVPLLAMQRQVQQFRKF